eukprot:TRINITY_DN27761_c0_g1_i1.p1 TRINITY_DN27761_c0_g1~~TRINITY_DN27761_c0_g1_i1.p1  ORF type:complete len:853 (+),score=107.25 TRINITY_DN27761_c0_g1_i1:91-2649(+)
MSVIIVKKDPTEWINQENRSRAEMISAMESIEEFQRQGPRHQKETLPREEEKEARFRQLIIVEENTDRAAIQIIIWKYQCILFEEGPEALDKYIREQSMSDSVAAPAPVEQQKAVSAAAPPCVPEPPPAAPAVDEDKLRAEREAREQAEREAREAQERAAREAREREEAARRAAQEAEDAERRLREEMDRQAQSKGRDARFNRMRELKALYDKEYAFGDSYQRRIEEEKVRKDHESLAPVITPATYGDLERQRRKRELAFQDAEKRLNDLAGDIRRSDRAAADLKYIAVDEPKKFAQEYPSCPAGERAELENDCQDLIRLINALLERLADYARQVEELRRKLDETNKWAMEEEAHQQRLLEQGEKDRNDAEAARLSQEARLRELQDKLDRERAEAERLRRQLEAEKKDALDNDAAKRLALEEAARERAARGLEEEKRRKAELDAETERYKARLAADDEKRRAWEEAEAERAKGKKGWSEADSEKRQRERLQQLLADEQSQAANLRRELEAERRKRAEDRQRNQALEAEHSAKLERDELENARRARLERIAQEVEERRQKAEKEAQSLRQQARRQREELEEFMRQEEEKKLRSYISHDPRPASHHQAAPPPPMGTDTLDAWASEQNRMWATQVVPAPPQTYPSPQYISPRPPPRQQRQQFQYANFMSDWQYLTEGHSPTRTSVDWWPNQQPRGGGGLVSVMGLLGSGTAEYSEFRDITIPLGSVVRLKKIFSEADYNGTGSLDLEKLAHWMQKKGETASYDRLQEMITQVDVNKNGKVEFWEFFGIQTYMSLQLHRRGVDLDSWMKYCTQTWAGGNAIDHGASYNAARDSMLIPRPPPQPPTYYGVYEEVWNV